MSDIGELNLKKLLEHAHIGVVIHRWDTSIAYANPTALRLLRLTYEQIIGKDAFDSQWCFLDDAGKKLLIEDYPVNKVKHLQERVSNEIIGVIDSSRDDISWFMINAYYEGDAGQDNSFIVVTFNDISDSKQLFSFHDIVENIQDMVIVTEAKDIGYPTGPKIIYVNQAFEQQTGYKKNEILGETPRLLQGALTDQASKHRIHSALKRHQAVNETLLNYDASGRPYWVEMNIIPLKNKYGEVTHFAAIERDISEHKFHLEQLKKRNQDLKILKRDLERLVEERTLELQKAKTKLEKIAFYDPLTKVPNRRYFIDHTNRLIQVCKRKKLPIAFGLLDIDDFKLLNDNYGHDFGDKVLKALASFLNQFFRAGDAFCRYGGEEFAFALSIEKGSALNSLSSRLMTGIRALKIAFSSNKNLSITVSIGFKICNSAPDIDLETEIKKADIALYQSKKEGKNRVTIVK
ncbi:diguanylate cyclase [Thalassomonas haliotis]|uniref:Diguanylate cyclase n=1 Tax=Thalassomonas haliotis TaxID=485448 RepID=A0ABY7V9W5_9GAMM|nr:diguanylate cyclase [Thalassomonas haliotis]WDE09698.1 diguanylate cyclase [Thalassomonas haliotis]